MPGIALTGASKGRLRPSFFFWGVLLALLVHAARAQQQVFRCGQEYTNTPQDKRRCEVLTPQAISTITGTRVQSQSAEIPPSSIPAQSPVQRAPDAPQRQRDEMARTIVGAELAREQERLNQWQSEQRQLQAMPHTDDPQHRQRLAQLQAAIERSVRDIDSLQRELTRRTPTKP